MTTALRTFVVLVESPQPQPDLEKNPGYLDAVVHKPFMMPGMPSSTIAVQQDPIELECGVTEGDAFLLADKVFHLRRRALSFKQPGLHLAIYEWGGVPFRLEDTEAGKLWEQRLRTMWLEYQGSLDELENAQREEIDVDEE